MDTMIKVWVFEGIVVVQKEVFHIVLCLLKCENVCVISNACIYLCC